MKVYVFKSMMQFVYWKRDAIKILSILSSFAVVTDRRMVNVDVQQFFLLMKFQVTEKSL